MSPTVKSVSIFSEESSSAYEIVRHSREPKMWIAESARWIAEALARRSTQLTHLSACYIIDASTFLYMALHRPLHMTPEEWKRICASDYPCHEPPEYSHWNLSPNVGPPSAPYPNWDHLEALTLTSRLLNPSQEDKAISGIFLKAGQLAKRMPKLRILEIWNGTNRSYTAGLAPAVAELAAREGHGFIFRYRCPRRSVTATLPSLLEFKSLWHFTPSKAVRAVWKEVAAAQHRRLELSMKYVEGKGFNTGLAVMEELATRRLVVSRRTWDEIRRGERGQDLVLLAGLD
ncbi:hypothetical protein B0H66DRAFT_597621 [Apodospora peruviana]|uniref:DUF6546 domain-containing protein n=1 Tax=Apodospora peruviana TaxID=516989 RepID=A0AAE0IRV4_9PEZI|nr:hypothetical protein B0H66DRAFT_597621 [Apodospora peruviana]